MAQEFPKVHWYAIDSRPMPRPSKNSPVTYKMQDFSRGFMFEDAYFDIVHCRNTFSMVRTFTDFLHFTLLVFPDATTFQIPNYRAFMLEIKRILKPGGLFLWTNSEPNIYLASRTNPSDSIPACVQMQKYCAHILARRNIQISLLPQFPALVKQIGGFKSDSSGMRHAVICVPNGVWDRKNWTQREIGEKSLQIILSSLSSAEPIFAREIGLSEEQFSELSRTVLNELSDPDVHTFHHYHTFYAIRE